MLIVSFIVKMFVIVMSALSIDTCYLCLLAFIAFDVNTGVHKKVAVNFCHQKSMEA